MGYIVCYECLQSVSIMIRQQKLELSLNVTNTPASILTETSILYTDRDTDTWTDRFITVYPRKTFILQSINMQSNPKSTLPTMLRNSGRWK